MRTTYTAEPSGVAKFGRTWYVFDGTPDTNNPTRVQGRRRALRAFQHARAGHTAFAPRPIRPHMRAIRALQHTPNPSYDRTRVIASLDVPEHTPPGDNWQLINQAAT